MMEEATCLCTHAYEQHAQDAGCCSPGCLCEGFVYDPEANTELEMEQGLKPGEDQK
jgi:hypothetical protein